MNVFVSNKTYLSSPFIDDEIILERFIERQMLMYPFIHISIGNPTPYNIIFASNTPVGPTGHGDTHTPTPNPRAPLSLPSSTVVVGGVARDGPRITVGGHWGP